MQIIDCTPDAHSDEMLAIFNEAIINSTALFDYQPRAPERMVEWFKAKTAGDFPVIGAISDDGQLLGFASYGVFRAWPAYKYSVEHSVYVHHQHRGKGIGRALLQHLIARATEQQYHLMIGGIEMSNAGSIALHQRLGFTHAGSIKHAAFKFGLWLDLGFYQLILDTPAQPVDG